VVRVIAIAGLALGQEAVQGRLIAQVQGLVGENGAAAIQSMLASANKPKAGIVAMAVKHMMERR